MMFGHLIKILQPPPPPPPDHPQAVTQADQLALIVQEVKLKDSFISINRTHPHRHPLDHPVEFQPPPPPPQYH